MKKRIVVLVSNDLSHDQRVKKVCATLLDLDYDITLVGRKLSTSIAFERPYTIRRFKLPFQKGALFYAALNIRLFFFLLFHKTDVILANDLDTLLPAFLISRLKGKRLVYDSHEYFTESAGLTGRSFQKRVWTSIESFIFPKLKDVITVNDSIAGFYKDKYNIDVQVVRNVPPKRSFTKTKTRQDLGIPENLKVVLLQGSFIDIDRGAIEAAEAIQYLNDVVFYVIGAGAEWEVVKKMSLDPKFEGKIRVFPKLPFDELMQYTVNADLGLSLDKPVHLNYKYSLPNKLFDYVQCQIPVLTSRLPELERVQHHFEIGMMVDNHNPKHIAERIHEALYSDRRDIWKSNLAKAAEVYNWENEEKVLREIYAY